MQQEFHGKENYTPNLKLPGKLGALKAQTDQSLVRSEKEIGEILLFRKRLNQKKRNGEKPFQIHLIAC